MSPPLNSVNPIDGGRPFIQLDDQNPGPEPSGFRSRDEFGLVVQQSATPQSHRGASPGFGLDKFPTPQSHRGGASPGFDELKRLPPPAAAAERSRSQQSANVPSSRLQQMLVEPQALQPQSHQGVASPGFDELKRLPPSATPERSRSQQSANRPSSSRLQQPRIQQSANQLQLLPNQQS